MNRNELREHLLKLVPTSTVLMVSELPDYTSPDDNPALLMCTAAELESAVTTALEDALWSIEGVELA